jgi:hypothetical protein
MDVKIENFISPNNLNVLAEAGLAKVAGAMYGHDEMTMREAFTEIGRRSFIKRAEQRGIADGIRAFAALTGQEKNAALERLLRPGSMAMPLLGAGMMAGPEMMSDGPVDWHSVLKKGLVGGAAGMVGGGIANLERTLKANPAVAQQLESAMARGI